MPITRKVFEKGAPVIKLEDLLRKSQELHERAVNLMNETCALLNDMRVYAAQIRHG